jgi:hypothetical protein
MPSEILKVFVPGAVPAPAAAPWAASIAASVFNALQRPWPKRWRAGVLASWRALEDHGRHRGQQELLRLVQRYAVTDPEIARQIRAAAQGLAAPR